ncbi:hypothetical protein ACFLZP_02545 [Patescibacteria group bacterium]
MRALAFSSLLKLKIKRFLAFFRTQRGARCMVVLGTCLVMAGLSGGIFLFSFYSFRFLDQYPETNLLIVIYSLTLTFILSSFLVLVSSFVTSLGNLYQKPDNQLLLSLPIPTKAIFASRAWEITLLSNWPLFVFALPQVLGFVLATKITTEAIFIILIGLFTLTLTFNWLGITLSLLVSFWIGRIRNHYLSLVMLFLIPLAAWATFKFLLPTPLTQNLGNLSLTEIRTLLKNQPLLAPFLPTSWLVISIIVWENDPQIAILNFLKLIGLFLAVWQLASFLKKKLYRRTIDKTATYQFIASPDDKVNVKNKSFPYFFKGRVGALVEKDWFLISRAPGQLFQLGFFLFLQILFFLIIASLPLANIQNTFSDWPLKKIIEWSYLFVGYLGCVLAIRFFFPLLSLEGQSSWIIWSAPISRKKVFYQKFLSSLVIFFLWLEISSFLLLKLLKISPLDFWPLFGINFPLSLGIVVLTVGLGTIFPNFAETNPEKLSTSTGGLICTFASLTYLSGIVFYIFSQNNLFSFFPQLIVWTTSLLISAGIFFRAQKRLSTY